MGKAKRGSIPLYRDRRRRLRRIRLAKRAGALLAAVIALIVLICAITKRPGKPAPPPEPSPAPTTAETPEPTPEPTEGPLTGGVRPPMAVVTSKEELIDLYWWMIETGSDTLLLDELTVSQGDISDITDKFSNYFDRYRAYFDPPGVRVAFKPGVIALVALQSGDISALDEDARAVAEAARDAIDGIITPGMSDWDKELAVHDYVVNHCQYTLDFLAPHSGDALGFFKYAEARCAGYCDVFRLLGRLAGLEVEMIGGPTTRDESGSKGHAWNLVKLDGRWYIVDTVWDDLIEAEPTLEHTFFNVPYAAFGGTRTWDADYLPEGPIAEALDQNYYYNRPEYTASSQADAVALAVKQLDATGKAYVLLPDRDMAQGVAAALKRHYGRSGSCFELSEDLDINLFRFRF